MNENHPITPPPELVREWAKTCSPYEVPADHIATQAARWGADMELEEGCWWLRTNKGGCFSSSVEREFLAARRPKPPSLKEQALDQLRSIQVDLTRCGMGISVETIRRALEQLDD